MPPNRVAAAKRRAGIPRPVGSRKDREVPSPVANKTQPSTPSTQTTQHDPYQVPFDRFYEESLRRIREQEAGLQSQHGLEQGRLREDIDYERGEAGKAHQEALKSLAERLSGQGILRSGINVAERGRLGEEHLRNLGSLGQAESRGLSDLARSYLTAQQGLFGQRETAELARIRAASEFAKEHAMSAAKARTLPGQIKGAKTEFRKRNKDIRHRSAASRRLKRKKR